MDRRGPPNDPTRLRINGEIKVPVVLLIDAEGEKIGEIPTPDAVRMAEEADLDLVEVAPNVSPPVCKILNYGKHRYHQQKRDHVAKRKSGHHEQKAIRLRPRIGPHDIAIKLGKARKFLEDGHRVQFNMLFRGREAAFADLGLKIMKELADTLSEVAKVERAPFREGRTMSMVVNPLKK